MKRKEKEVQEPTLTANSTLFALMEMAVGHRHDTVFEMAQAVDEVLQDKRGATLGDPRLIESRWGRRG
jgi:hypothetical protein